MQRHQQFLSVAVALALWAGPANATPPEADGVAPAAATWSAVDARNHANGISGSAAVVFGVAQERGRRWRAVLRVACFEGVTTVHVDVLGAHPGPSAVAVRQSLDGGRFVAGAWQAGADGSLALSGERAIAFLGELYGRTELRLAVVRPLSVPFLFTFAVDGAEQGLRTLADRCQWSSGPAIAMPPDR